MKNLIRVILCTAVLASLFSGLCFAEGPDDSVIDNRYPSWNFYSHSWTTGSGDNVIAHTQIISTTTGEVLKQLDVKCSFVNGN